MTTATSHEVTLRSGGADDAGRLIEMFRDTVRTVNRADYNDEQVRAWAPDTINRTAWETRLSNSTCILAEANGEAVGFTELTADGHVDMLYVHKDHQRRGIARLLLDAAEGMARDRDLGHLTTHASLTARPFFERAGFHVVREQQVELRGQTLTNFRMTKTLS